MLAVTEGRWRDSRFMSKVRFTPALLILAALSTAFFGCTPAQQPHHSLMQTVSTDRVNPFGGAPAVDIPDDAKAMGAFLKAEVAMNEGDRDEALTQYEEAVKYDPHSPELRVQLATMYVRSGRLKEALEQVNHAIAEKPNDPDALLLAAGINSALGNDADAEQDYKAVLRSDPKNQEAYLYLGTLYAKREDYTNAAATFNKLIDADPSSFLGYYYAGRGVVAG